MPCLEAEPGPAGARFIKAAKRAKKNAKRNLKRAQDAVPGAEGLPSMLGNAPDSLAIVVAAEKRRDMTLEINSAASVSGANGESQREEKPPNIPFSLMGEIPQRSRCGSLSSLSSDVSFSNSSDISYDQAVYEVKESEFLKLKETKAIFNWRTMALSTDLADLIHRPTQTYNQPFSKSHNTATEVQAPQNLRQEEICTVIMAIETAQPPQVRLPPPGSMSSYPNIVKNASATSMEAFQAVSLARETAKSPQILLPPQGTMKTRLPFLDSVKMAPTPPKDAFQTVSLALEAARPPHVKLPPIGTFARSASPEKAIQTVPLSIENPKAPRVLLLPKSTVASPLPPPDAATGALARPKKIRKPLHPNNITPQPWLVDENQISPMPEYPDPDLPLPNPSEPTPTRKVLSQAARNILLAQSPLSQITVDLVDKCGFTSYCIPLSSPEGCTVVSELVVSTSTLCIMGFFINAAEEIWRTYLLNAKNKSMKDEWTLLYYTQQYLEETFTIATTKLGITDSDKLMEKWGLTINLCALLRRQARAGDQANGWRPVIKITDLERLKKDVIKKVNEKFRTLTRLSWEIERRGAHKKESLIPMADFLDRKRSGGYNPPQAQVGSSLKPLARMLEY